MLTTQRPNGKHEVDAMTRLNSLYVIVHEDGDEMLDIHIHSDRISKGFNTRYRRRHRIGSHLTKRRGVRKCCKIVLIGLLVMCLIITFELWQSNKRLKKMFEQDKSKKMARLFDENRALEDKAFNVVRQYELECD